MQEGRHGHIPWRHHLHHRPRELYTQGLRHCHIPTKHQGFKICYLHGIIHIWVETKTYFCDYNYKQLIRRVKCRRFTIWGFLSPRWNPLRPESSWFHSDSQQNNCWSGKTASSRTPGATWYDSKEGRQQVDVSVLILSQDGAIWMHGSLYKTETPTLLERLWETGKKREKVKYCTLMACCAETNASLTCHEINYSTSLEKVGRWWWMRGWGWASRHKHEAAQRRGWVDTCG